MNREQQFRKNNELFELFVQEVLESPDFVDKIPDDAEVIFLPQNDPELCEANRRLGKAREKEGRKVVYVRIELVPEVRTVFVPHLVLAEEAA